MKYFLLLSFTFISFKSYTQKYIDRGDTVPPFIKIFIEDSLYSSPIVNCKFSFCDSIFKTVSILLEQDSILSKLYYSLKDSTEELFYSVGYDVKPSGDLKTYPKYARYNKEHPEMLDELLKRQFESKYCNNKLDTTIRNVFKLCECKMYPATRLKGNRKKYKSTNLSFTFSISKSGLYHTEFKDWENHHTLIECNY